MRAHCVLLSLVAVAGLCGCRGGKLPSPYRLQVAGSPERGQTIIVQFRCGSCHMIPGIHNAKGLVGPPLNEMSRRTFIAGEIPNDPQNLVHWVEAPTSLKPKTAMPDLGLTNQQATDVVAYLETLR
jgi:cytochrome c